MSKKRRANGTGSIFKRPDGRWEGKYFVGYDPKTGNPIRKSVYGKTQKEVKDKMLPFLSEISRGTYIPPSKITLEDWFRIWLRDYSCDNKWGTLKGYRASIYTHIVPVLGKYYLEDLTPIRVQMFYNGLSQPDENGVVLSPKSIRNIHIAFRAAMQQAVENDLIRRNPCHNAKLPKVYKTEVHPLSDDQVAQFLEMAKPDEQYGIVLRVILFTGLREGEALGLTWDCVDFAKGSITINKQLQRRPQHAGGTQLVPTKNGKYRVLRPAPFVMDLLKERYNQQILQSKRASVAWEAWHDEKGHKKALVFTNEIGRYLVPKRVYLHFRAIADAIGAPNARVHDLRHTFAVLSLQNGDDVKTVQTNLGHASAAFTLDVYGHVSDRMQRESAARMENYISNLKKQPD